MHFFDRPLAASFTAIAFCIGLVSSVRAAEAVDPFRLTNVVEPVAEAVELKVDPAKDDFSGVVRIDVIVHQETKEFRLHALGPVITSATFDDLSGKSLTPAWAVTEAELGLITMTLPTAVQPGTYRLTLSFDNKYNRSGLGLYKTVSRGDAYLFTQFEDRHARKAFPCWDDPGFKIPWQLTLTLPTALEVVSNAPIAQESASGTTKTVEFGRTPPMPSYLVALAVGPFEFTPVPGLSVPGRIVSPRGQAGLAAEAARVSPALLAQLEAYFGIPYPYAKLDQIAVPEYVYGAMENAGLITYVDGLLLMDPTKPSFEARRRLANTAAHEMAHMWFGDLVTMAWWDDLWLNESFADWICAKIVEQTHPDYRIYIQQLSSIQGAMRTDSLPSVKPIRRPLTARDDPEEVSDELTYSKGKAILNMVENWIGPEKFRAAMHAYFLKHRWGNTTAADLWAAFDESSGEKISVMLAAFIEKPGIPFVTFALQPGGKLQLTQRRFTNLGDAPAPGQWQVPVVIAWSKDGQVRRERVLLKEETQTLDVPGLAEADWIYPNAGEAGYYRWSFSTELNARLTQHVAKLSTLERFGLIDNANALLNAGQLTGGDYLAYLAAFATDEEPEITMKLAGLLGGVRETFVSSEQLAKFDALRSALLRPALTRIGLKPKAGEPSHIAPLRAQLFTSLGTTVNDPEVVAVARELTGQYLKDPTSLDASLAGAALRVASYHGDAPLFDAIQAALGKATAPSVHSQMISALGSFNDPALVSRGLAYSLTDKLNSTEFLNIAFNAAGNIDLRPQVVAWVMANYDAIKAKAPAPYVAYLIGTGEGCEEALFFKLRDFLRDPSRSSQFAEINIIKSSERFSLRMRLRQKEQAGVNAYLAKFSVKR